MTHSTKQALPAIMIALVMILFPDCINKSQQSKGENPGTGFGNPEKIDVAVVTGGHGFHPEEFFAIFQGQDDLEKHCLAQMA